jgi:hypothetical protein
MKMRASWNLAIAVIIGLFLFSTAAAAHQPRLVEDPTTEIMNPEVSQAFYGELKGYPDVFRIVADKPFNLYVGILVPDIPNIKKDISAKIDFEGIKSDEELFPYLLDGLTSDWKSFHEDFANDDYFWGPEFKAPDSPAYTPTGIEVGPGTYLITVFSPDNYGKFVLVVGEKEIFPLNEIVNTMRVLPIVKSELFNKPAWEAFFNIIGLFLLVPVLVALIVIALIWRFVIVLRRRKRTVTGGNLGSPGLTAL